jgi:hypothetical protein
VAISGSSPLRACTKAGISSWAMSASTSSDIGSAAGRAAAQAIIHSAIPPPLLLCLPGWSGQWPIGIPATGAQFTAVAWTLIIPNGMIKTASNVNSLQMLAIRGLYSIGTNPLKRHVE